MILNSSDSEPKVSLSNGLRTVGIFLLLTAVLIISVIYISYTVSTKYISPEYVSSRTSVSPRGWSTYTPSPSYVKALSVISKPFLHFKIFLNKEKLFSKEYECGNFVWKIEEYQDIYQNHDRLYEIVTLRDLVLKKKDGAEIHRVKDDDFRFYRKMINDGSGGTPALPKNIFDDKQVFKIFTLSRSDLRYSVAKSLLTNPDPYPDGYNSANTVNEFLSKKNITEDESGGRDSFTRKWVYLPVDKIKDDSVVTCFQKNIDTIENDLGKKYSGLSRLVWIFVLFDANTTVQEDTLENNFNKIFFLNRN